MWSRDDENEDALSPDDEAKLTVDVREETRTHKDQQLVTTVCILFPSNYKNTLNIFIIDMGSSLDCTEFRNVT